MLHEAHFFHEAMLIFRGWAPCDELKKIREHFGEIIAEGAAKKQSAARGKER
jgi:hypothetical protein